jgi:hypothetical protein
MKLHRALVLCLIAAVGAAGCGKRDEGSPRAALLDASISSKKKEREKAKPAEREKAAKADATKEKPAPPPNPQMVLGDEAGVIRGQVTWAGTPPEAPAKRDDLFVLRDGRKVPVTLGPPVVVDHDSGGVAGAMVWLEKPPDTAAPLPPIQMKVTQAQAGYLPHVQFLPRESRLQLRTTNDAADFHLSGALRFNRSLRRGEQALVRAARPGLITVHSDDHPWMAPAYLRVVDHAFYALTDRDGRFDLPKVPAGQYEVVLWHPPWAEGGRPAEVRVPVKLTDGQGAAIRWTIGGPG